MALSGVGFLGMGLADWIRGEDEEGEDDDGDAEEGMTDGGDALFADPDEEMDDDFDDFDDIDGLGDADGMDDLDDGLGGNDSDTSDLEPRLEELESEIGNISSTMNTVRSENESMREAITETEENVRKLLEIYEVVTQGVNPFVDDVEEGEFDGDSFGLFDAEEGDADTEDPDEERDTGDDGFFDDDFPGEVGGGDSSDTDDSEEDGSEAEANRDEQASGETAEDGAGKTFEELKSEYESDSAEWVGDAEAQPAEEGSSDEADDAPATQPATTDAGQDAALDHPDGKPYLTSLPGGYVTEFVLLEWLGYLLDHADAAGALRAINYYETIDWIGADAAEQLRTALEGFHEGRGGRSTGGGPQLTIDHHVRSLEYIGQLAGDELDTEIEAWPMEGGHGL